MAFRYEGPLIAKMSFSHFLKNVLKGNRHKKVTLGNAEKYQAPDGPKASFGTPGKPKIVQMSFWSWFWTTSRNLVSGLPGPLVTPPPGISKRGGGDIIPLTNPSEDIERENAPRKVGLKQKSAKCLTRPPVGDFGTFFKLLKLNAVEAECC